MFTTFKTLLEKILPTWIFQRLIGDWDPQGFKKYFNNTSWLFAAKIFSFAVSFLTIAVVARYLGPENYGKLSYAQSFVSIFSVLASLGIDRIVYRDLITYPTQEKEILGTAFITKIIFGFLAIFVTIVSAYTLNNDPILNWLIILITITFIFHPFSIVSHYFNAKVQSKYTAYITILVAFCIPALKLALIYFDKGIIYFAALITFEAFIASVAYVYFYIKIYNQSLYEWYFSTTMFKSLIRRSWPLLLASLSGYIYGRIDQIMIQHFIDSSAVGLYDVAVRITEFLGWIPGLIIGSLFPAVMNARTRNNSEYAIRFKSLVILCISISTLSALIIYILSPFIINKLFGSDFNQSINILRLYVWSTIGTLGIILIEQYFIAENNSKQFLFFSFSGASLNIVLNFILIPIYGIQGAIYATLGTMTIVVISFVLYQIFWVKTKSEDVNI